MWKKEHCNDKNNKIINKYTCIKVVTNIMFDMQKNSGKIIFYISNEIKIMGDVVE